MMEGAFGLSNPLDVILLLLKMRKYSTNIKISSICFKKIFFTMVRLKYYRGVKKHLFGIVNRVLALIVQKKKKKALAKRKPHKN